MKEKDNIKTLNIKECNQFYITTTFKFKLKDITKVMKGNFYIDTDYYYGHIYNTNEIENGEDNLPNELLEKEIYIMSYDKDKVVVYLK